jgi:hypothetical protein
VIDLDQEEKYLVFVDLKILFWTFQKKIADSKGKHENIKMGPVL